MRFPTECNFKDMIFLHYWRYEHFKSLFFHNWIPDHYFLPKRKVFCILKIIRQDFKSNYPISKLYFSLQIFRQRTAMTKLCVILLALLGECSKSFTFYVIRTIISSGYFKNQLWLKQETQFYSELQTCRHSGAGFQLPRLSSSETVSPQVRAKLQASHTPLCISSNSF